MTQKINRKYSLTMLKFRAGLMKFFRRPLRRTLVRSVPCASSKNNFPWINSLILVVFISSCHVAKEYQQPELELPKQFNTAIFADTTLQSLIDRGITYNYDLLGAIKRREIAQQRVTQSKYLNLPEINLQA